MSTKKTTILIADDDPQLVRLVALTLVLEGYEVLVANDGEQALEQIKEQKPHLILLDVIMPRMDGFTVCQRVREFSLVPIIILTARGQDQDKTYGLDIGADDYLTKPFGLDELLARVRAVLRRAEFSPNEHPYAMHTAIGELAIDHTQHLVTVAGREIELTPTEYSMLTYLAHNAGRIVLQDVLLEHVWGPEYNGEGHLLQVNISRLRHKLEPDPAHPCYILTKPGIGYLLAVPPHLPNGVQDGRVQADCATTKTA